MALLGKLFSGHKKHRRALIIGLDGVPYTLMKRFIDEGVMPNTAALIKTGALCRMTTSLPEVSSVAWTSFMTGVNPGRHGIYGFMDLRPRTYDMFFPDFKCVKAETLWGVLGRSGRRSIVINVPSTYPAGELNGILISGFVAIDLKKATYPQSYVPLLEQMKYRLDVDANKARESMDLFAEDLRETLRRREEALLHFIEKEEWDLFIATIAETDRLHHFLWAASDNPAHPYHRFFIEIYRWIDRIIGELYAKVDKETAVFMVSDHGFTHIRSEVYINKWLEEEGYLRFAKTPPESHRDIAEGTRAFNLDPARIYINLKGKYPKGNVELGREYQALREEIKGKLECLQVEGQAVVKKVYYKEEIFSGPEIELAPDIVVLSNYGFDMKGSLNKVAVTGRSIFTGMHTQDDALFFASSAGLYGRQEMHDVNIVDVMPTVLAAMGVESGQSLDGRVV
jgi:predicted AlkP superfamily phosphohydrolase/phosphomutase